MYIPVITYSICVFSGQMKVNYWYLFVLIFGQHCFTGKHTASKIHMKLHLVPKYFIFHILTSDNIDDVISHFFTIVYTNSQFIHKIRWNYMMAWIYEFYFLVSKTIFYSLPVLLCKILFMPLKNRLRIFMLLCNIFYILMMVILPRKESTEA